MPLMKTRRAALFLKIEATPGTEAAPATATDGVRVENLHVKPAVGTVTTNEVSASLDLSSPIILGAKAELSFDFYLKGSGPAAAPTPGVAPEWGKVMKICRFAEALQAASVPVGAAEALVAGGATGGTLGATPAATLQLYRGLPLVFAANPAGGITFIYDYLASKVFKATDTFSPVLGVTSTYNIPVNVLYSPISTPPLLTATAHVYRDGKRIRLVGLAGNITGSLQASGPAKMSFKGSGILLAEEDAAFPTFSYPDSTVKPIWRSPDGVSGAATLDALKIAVSKLDIGLGNNLTYPEDPNAVEGFAPAEIVSANITAVIDPLSKLVATYDLMTKLRQATPMALHARLGQTAGNRLGFTFPTVLMTDRDIIDRNGLAADSIPVDALGDDSGMYICIY